MKQIDNRGFTLVELLATIVIVGILTSFTIITIVDYYHKSKDKAEEAFYKQLEGYVEDYITLYGRKLKYKQTTHTNLQKCYTDNGIEKCNSTILYEINTTANSIPGIDSVAIEVTNSDIINPKNNIKCTNSNIELNFYRDSDYVYCFTIKPKGNDSCIKENISISTCENIYKNGSSYLSFK